MLPFPPIARGLEGGLSNDASWSFETSEWGLFLDEELTPGGWLLDMSGALVAVPEGVGN